MRASRDRVRQHRVHASGPLDEAADEPRAIMQLGRVAGWPSRSNQLSIALLTRSAGVERAAGPSRGLRVSRIQDFLMRRRWRPDFECASELRVLARLVPAIYAAPDQ